MDDEEPKTMAAASRTGVLIALSNVETRFEQLQKKVAALDQLSGPAVTLLRRELNALQQQIDRVLAAAESIEKEVIRAKDGGDAPPDRF